jgi:hypothetical protein
MIKTFKDNVKKLLDKIVWIKNMFDYKLDELKTIEK